MKMLPEAEKQKWGKRMEGSKMFPDFYTGAQAGSRQILLAAIRRHRPPETVTPTGAVMVRSAPEGLERPTPITACGAWLAD
jgi:hypothetical protein